MILRASSLLALAAAAAALAASTPASAATGSSYVASVNALCRSYTPRLHRIAAAAKAAYAAGKLHEWAYDVGLGLGQGLREIHQIERMPVPPDFASAMAKPLSVLETLDREETTMLQRAVNGDAAGFYVYSLRVAKLEKPFNNAFDAVGLRDCGSNQG